MYDLNKHSYFTTLGELRMLLAHLPADPRQLRPRNSSLYLGCLWSCHRRDEEEQRGSDGELFASSFKLVRSQKKVVKGHIEVLQNSNSNQKETRYKQKTCNAHSW